MTTPSTSPRGDRAGTGEGDATIIAFPLNRVELDAALDNSSESGQKKTQWPGALIDLDAARAMVEPAEDQAASRVDGHSSAEGSSGNNLSGPELDGPELDGPVLDGLELDGPQRRGTGIDVAEVDDAETVAAAKNLAIRSLAARARSEAELRQKLADRGYLGDVIDEVASQLIQQRLIDDRQLAHDEAHRLADVKQLGPVAIRRALVKRRISRVIIDDVVATLPAPDDDGLEQLVRSRMRVLQGLDRDVQTRRLVAFLARRGYQGPDAYRAIDRVVGDAEGAKF